MEDNDLKFPETREAGRALIKFVATANAGGIAATIAMLGATAKNGCFEKNLAVPLLFFAAGVFSAIMYSLCIFLRIAVNEKFENDAPPLLMKDKALYISGYTAIACFPLGVFVGFIIFFTV